MDRQQFTAIALRMLAIQLAATKAGKPLAARRRLRTLATQSAVNSTLATRAPVDAVAESSLHGPKVLQFSDSDRAGLTKDPVHASAVSDPSGQHTILSYSDAERQQAAGSQQQSGYPKRAEPALLAWLDLMIEAWDGNPNALNSAEKIWREKLHDAHKDPSLLRGSREKLAAERNYLTDSWEKSSPATRRQMEAGAKAIREACSGGKQSAVNKPAANSQQQAASKPAANQDEPDGCAVTCLLAYYDVLLARYKGIPVADEAVREILDLLHRAHWSLEPDFMKPDELAKERARLLASFPEGTKKIRLRQADAIAWHACGEPPLSEWKRIYTW